MRLVMLAGQERSHWTCSLRCDLISCTAMPWSTLGGACWCHDARCTVQSLGAYIQTYSTARSPCSWVSTCAGTFRAHQMARQAPHFRGAISAHADLHASASCSMALLRLCIARHAEPARTKDTVQGLRPMASAQHLWLADPQTCLRGAQPIVCHRLSMLHGQGRIHT